VLDPKNPGRLVDRALGDRVAQARIGPARHLHDVVPAQRAQLAAAQPGARQDLEDRAIAPAAHRRAVGHRQQRAELLRRQRPRRRRRPRLDPDLLDPRINRQAAQREPAREPA
jgi:hypothetical protein